MALTNSIWQIRRKSSIDLHSRHLWNYIQVLSWYYWPLSVEWIPRFGMRKISGERQRLVEVHWLVEDSSCVWVCFQSELSISRSVEGCVRDCTFVCVRAILYDPDWLRDHQLCVKVTQVLCSYHALDDSNSVCCLTSARVHLWQLCAWNTPPSSVYIICWFSLEVCSERVQVYIVL